MQIDNLRNRTNPTTLCDRCGKTQRKYPLEEMPNGDFVCVSCSKAEERAVSETYRDASEIALAKAQAYADDWWNGK